MLPIISEKTAAGAQFQIESGPGDPYRDALSLPEEWIMKNTLQHRNWISRMRPAAAGAALALAAVLVSAATTTQPAQAQTYTVLASFDGTDGSYSLAPLVQATNGNLYGTTDQVADGSGYGTVFEITTSGTLTSLYTFCLGGALCADGDGPVAGLVQATNGDFYGTTEYGGGGSQPLGTVFKIKSSGTLTSLYTFAMEDGSGPYPTAGLVQATNGVLFGATVGGGVNGAGTLFKITEGGTLSTIYSFCSNPVSGDCLPTSISARDGYDALAGLIQATNGDLYGTTVSGGINGGGTVFKTSLSGALTVLYRFCSQINGNGTCTDGANPSSVLVQAANGNLYGTTAEGGTGAACPVFYGCGTIFEITPTGTLTTLYSFCSQSGCADGANLSNLEGPQPALIQATDGNLYGTTPFGGNTTSGVNTNGWGTIFKITPSGALTTLYTFCEVSGCYDGGQPIAGLVQDTNGTFYGTTSVGNGTVLGTVFSVSTGLGPFVEIQPRFAGVGKAVTILGTDLTGATSVTFNGTKATFTVVSSSEITTTVPTGATAGYVTVTTPSGTLTSNVPFRLSAALIPTTTTLTSSLNPSTFGEAVTFTAVVSSNAGAPPNGETVSFQKGTMVLGTGTLSGGSASFTTSTLPVGTTSVKAVYGADAYFKGSTSNVVHQVVH
jgi:uncharacterized repeat protein (TIGR03803 family)